MLIGISDQMGARSDRLRCEVFQNLILSPMNTSLLRYAVATALTVYGIETFLSLPWRSSILRRCNSSYRLRYAQKGARQQRRKSDDEVRTSLVPERREGKTKVMKQQHLPFMVCAAECETAEEQRDDEVRTSQVPERSEGKTKVIGQQCLPFTVLKPV